MRIWGDITNFRKSIGPTIKFRKKFDQKVKWIQYQTKIRRSANDSAFLEVKLVKIQLMQNYTDHKKVTKQPERRKIITRANTIQILSANKRSNDLYMHLIYSQHLDSSSISIFKTKWLLSKQSAVFKHFDYSGQKIYNFYNPKDMIWWFRWLSSNLMGLSLEAYGDGLNFLAHLRPPLHPSTFQRSQDPGKVFVNLALRPVEVKPLTFSNSRRSLLTKI